jgi:hypothetical protein
MDIANFTQCHSQEISHLESLCVWGRDDLNNEICVMKNNLECNNYLTTLGCTWSNVNENEYKKKRICKWDDDASPHCTNSPGCGDLKMEGLVCKDYISDKGVCFFNGEDDVITEANGCSDSVDIDDCNQFTSLTWDSVSGSCNTREGIIDDVCHYLTLMCI